LRSTESEIDNRYWRYVWYRIRFWNLFWRFKNRLFKYDIRMNFTLKLKIFRTILRIAKNFLNI
jgi:hypothetical protein